MTFGNPIGLLALLGVPAVLAIHFLQRRHQPLVITTRFLLDQVRLESASGTRWERLRSSLPLWLQLLAVALIAWLLSDPRWRRDDTTVQVAVVLDASASMSAFRDDALDSLAGRLPAVAGSAARAELTAVTTGGSEGRIYSGDDAAELVAAARERWHPALGHHDPEPALRLGRSLAGPEGVVVFVTDRRPESALAFGALALAVGDPAPNVGFAGVTVRHAGGAPVWSALVRNYGAEAVTRTWWVESDAGRTPTRTIELGPSGVRAIQGPFPGGSGQVVLRLEQDRFPLDDSLPAVVPRRKPLTYAVPPPLGEDPSVRRLLESLDDLTEAPPDSDPDLTVAAADPLNPPVALPSGNGIVFLRPTGGSNAVMSGLVVQEDHPLNDGVSWQGLLATRSPGIPSTPGDDVLVWQGEDRPLVLVRQTSPGSQLLCFNFDFARSNAGKLAAPVVAVHRFAESLRAAKVAAETANLETGQDLAFAFDVAAGAPPLRLRVTPAAPAGTGTGAPPAEPVAVEFPLAQASRVDAPPRPGFFEVTQGDTLLVRGAAHFADTREADLSGASSADELDPVAGELVQLNSRTDPLWRLWLLAALAVVTGSWWALRPHPAPTARGTTAPGAPATGA